MAIRSPDRACARARVAPQIRAYNVIRPGDMVVDVRGALPVPQLPDVEVADCPSSPVTRCQPRKMSLAACIRRWPATTRCPWLRVLALAEEPLQHRLLGLLGLQEQRVAAVAAEHQHDPGAGADAADADDLAGRVDVVEVLEQHRGGRSPACAGRTGSGRAARRSKSSRSSSGGSRSSIGTISGGSATIRRWPSTTWVSLANACMLSRVRALATFACGLRLLLLRWHWLAARSSSSLDVDVRVPDVQVAHRRGLAHRASGTRPTAGSDDRAPVASAAKPRSRPAISKLAASRLTSHSHGPGQGLVEVVDVEHQLALGRGEDAEVRQVRVAADLGRRCPTAACRPGRRP